MWKANPTWGSPKIVAELAMLGIDVAKSTVETYQPKRAGPSSPTWKTFLDQHVRDLVSIDFFIVPTAAFRVLFVFIVLAHDRRRIVHFNVTEHPTAQWTAQQIVEAFPFDTAPSYTIRDGDGIYGEEMERWGQALEIKLPQIKAMLFHRAQSRRLCQVFKYASPILYLGVLPTAPPVVGKRDRFIYRSPDVSG
jgi:hypothetical protein